VEVAAELLEARRQQHDIRLVDLLGRVPPTARIASDSAMRRLDLVEGGGALVLPLEAVDPSRLGT
jgi:uncharacterized membrane protein YqiK